MSGENFSGTFVGRIITTCAALMDQPMSEFQKSSINLCEIKDIKEFNENKVASIEKLEKLVSKYEQDLWRWHSQGTKYAMYAYRLGVSYFGKFKPSYIKYGKQYHRARSDEEASGFVFGDVFGKDLSKTYKTEALAKKDAMSKLKDKPDLYSLIVFKCYRRKVSGVVSKLIPLGEVGLTEVGQMKSLPKKQPKSYTVVPVYFYMWDATVSDPEYEWM